jgi:hypothetical protein
MEKLTLAYSVVFFLLILGVSVLAYAIRTAECYEQEDDAIPGQDMEPVNYKDIMDCERPYIEHQYN